MINFLTGPDVLGVSAEQAGRLLTLYWCGSMTGRFVGSAVMARIDAGRVLGISAFVASVLCLTVSQSTGVMAAIAALSIGCFNSIMFPTIFTLTLARSSASTTSTSGLLCTAIVGGAVLPPLCGLTADAAGIAAAFLIPSVAYLYVAGFGLVARK
jgi:MFS transporter, FHS family, L-fucose permease